MLEAKYVTEKMIVPTQGLGHTSQKYPANLLGQDEALIIVDDDYTIREPLKTYFEEHGFPVKECESAQGLWDLLAGQAAGLILLDIHLPDRAGDKLVPDIQAQYPDVAIVMLSGVADIHVAMECIRSGADDFLAKPVQFNEILHVVQKTLEKRQLVLENRRYQRDLEQAHFRINLLHQLSLKMNTVYLSTIELDEILKAILVGITAHEGLRFNRAFLAMFDDKGDYLIGKMGIGPDCRDDAEKIWSEMKDKELNFLDIVKNLPASCSNTNGEINRVVHSLRVPVTDEQHILIQVARQRSSLNVIEGSCQVPVPADLLQLLDEDSFAVVPLYSPGRTLGVIIADNYVTSNPIPADQISVLELFANQASLAIEHSHLYTDMQQKIGELESLNHELEKNKDLLIEAERYSALGQMSAQMVHVIRNPITSIGGVSRILSRKLPDENLKRYLNVIITEADRLEKTLSDLFDFVNKTDSDMKNEPLYPIIKKALLLVQTTLQKQGISWVLELPEPSPVLSVDHRQILQMIHHLIRNAIEAMAKGGTLTIRAEEEEGWVKISIKDSGKGFSSLHSERVKDPFFTTKTYGTGMGLTMVERLVTAHGGHFMLNSQTNGLEAVISLPLDSEPDKAP